MIYQVHPHIRLIICDMAGTTVNEGGIVYKTLVQTIKRYGLEIGDNEIKYWYGVNKTEVLKYFLNRSGEDDTKLPEMLTDFKTNLKKNYFEDKTISLINPKLPHLFNTLRERGIKIALNSGFSVDIQEALIDNLEMRNFIDGYISSESVPQGRPEPYMIQELMKRFNIDDPNQVIKLGDSVNDILEGKNAKCFKSIGVLSGAERKQNLLDAGADMILNSVMDLM
jgi:phosphonatase-like hydrolase